MNVFLSNDYRDINFARDAGVQRMTVIPNGASEEEFLKESGIDIRGRLNIPPDHFLVLHVGSHTGLKGHAEAIKIFSRARIKKATFLIVANEAMGGCANACLLRKALFNLLPHRLADDRRIVIRQLSREETVAAYREADIFLFPSNIECSPLVLFESMASGTPFLTTEVGNAAEIIIWSGAGLLLPTKHTSAGYSRADVPGSATLLTELYGRQALREDMAEKGFRIWQDRFTWRKIGREYEKLYLCVLGSSG